MIIQVCKTVFILFFVSVFSGYCQAPVINEVLASNANGQADEDGDTPDWIELYNPTSETINLLDWGLSDSYTEPLKWQFPDIELPPGGFLLVFASGKNRHTLPLHTNFKVTQEKDQVILSNPFGNWEDVVVITQIPTDVSYGRQPDGTGAWHYFADPTPGESNNNHGFAELLPIPEFSHEPGFYTEPFYLKIVDREPGVTYYYTLDGSPPNTQSTVFPDSLLIYNRESDPDDISAIPTTPLTAPEWFRWYPPADNVYKGTTIRVWPHKEDALSPLIHTSNYWVDDDIHNRYSLPIISLSMDKNHVFGSAGIYTNFASRGINWERPVHVAFFEPDGKQAFATDAGIRVHGGNSRRYCLKSFRLYFRNTYGDARVEYPVFGNYPIDTHERLILRNAGSDWSFTYYRDAYVQNILRDFSDVETQAYQPAIVFLNSEYWGILNIRERFDDKFIEHHFGQTQIDMLENTGQVIYGSSAHYTNLLSFLNNADPLKNENYQWLTTQMEMDNFRDYHILQVFSMNTDQPGKNVRFWRPQTPDGKWRWMWWDMDDAFHFGPHNTHEHNGIVFCTGLNSISATTINPATRPPSWAPNGATQTFPLRALLYYPEFRISFLNRFADLLNTAFEPQALIQLVEEFDNTISPYLYEHYRRWHRPEPEVYTQHKNRLIDFSSNRQQIMRDDLVDFFELEGMYQLSLDIGSGKGHIRVNTLNINESLPHITLPVYPWQGQYFAEVPLEIEAIAAPGYQFSHWEGSFAKEPLIAIQTKNNTILKAHFAPLPEKDLIAFWFFGNDVPNNTPLLAIEPYFSENETISLEYSSCLKDYPFHQNHPRWRKASMERRNRPTDINYKPRALNDIPYNTNNMRGLQVKQPFRHEERENEIILHLSSLNYKNLSLSLAAINENAADKIVVEYSTKEHGTDWKKEGLSHDTFTLTDNYQLIIIDFSLAPQTENNPFFKVRIRFEDTEKYGDQGNRVTLNNISFEGIFLKDLADSSLIHNDSFVVFPNPVRKGEELHTKRHHDLWVYDLQGRVQFRQNHTQIIHTTNWSPGIYIIQNELQQRQKITILP